MIIRANGEVEFSGAEIDALVGKAAIEALKLSPDTSFEVEMPRRKSGEDRDFLRGRAVRFGCPKFQSGEINILDVIKAAGQGKAAK